MKADGIVAAVTTFGLGVLMAGHLGVSIARGDYRAAVLDVVLGLPLLWIWHRIISQDDLL